MGAKRAEGFGNMGWRTWLRLINVKENNGEATRVRVESYTKDYPTWDITGP